MDTKQIPGLSKYLIRSDGEVVSLWKAEPKILSGGRDKDGYKKMVLIDDMGARRYVRRASLVCCAFHGPRPKGMEVRHLDGSRDNDAAHNLAWSSHADNCGDKIGHGTSQRGERNGNAVISEETAKLIKGRLSAGDSGAKIARELLIARHVVYQIKYGRCWAWL